MREVLEKVVITRGINYPIRYFYKDCVLSEKERMFYETAAKGILDEDSEKAMAARLWDLQRIVDGSSEYMNKDLYSELKLLIETLKEIIDRGEGVLIYTELEDTYRFIGDAIESYQGYLGYSQLYYITGKTPYEKRVECEKRLKRKDIVIVTRAGSSSINLQAVNNVVFYDLPFAISSLIQMVGRVARTDSVYKNQNVYVLEVKETIDTYKRLLLQSYMTLIQSIFGEDSTLPYYGDIDKDVVQKYRQYFKNKMLWCRT